MNDQVLTDDEKGALLDGVENGEVEVLSDNIAKYANVAAFDVPPRNRITTNSYPRLQNIDRKLAALIGKSLSLFLNHDVEVASGAIASLTWGDFQEQWSEAALIFEFTAHPLEGPAFVVVPSGTVRVIVETFYGGSKHNPPVHEIDGFTPGEAGVIALFCRDVLRGITEAWDSVVAFDAKEVALHRSADIVEVVENSAAVLETEFTLYFDEERFGFHIVWPSSTLAALLPVLGGGKGERDTAEDARWERAIRSRLMAAPVDIHSRVGNASMSLREVAALEPGDVIELDDPRNATVFAEHVPVLKGRFGVHEGRFAIEATRWVVTNDAPESPIRRASTA